MSSKFDVYSSEVPTHLSYNYNEFLISQNTQYFIVTGEPFISIIEEQDKELKRLRALESAVKNIFHDDQIRKLTTGKRVVYR